MSKRIVGVIVISSRAEGSTVVHCATQLACVNRKIAERVTNSSNAHAHAIFAEAGKGHDVSVPLDEAGAGLTIHCNDEPLSSSGPRLMGHCTLRKVRRESK